jgi:lysophospholipase L1-like esterase
VIRALPVLIFVAALLSLSSCAANEPPLAYVSLGDSLAVGVGASDPRERGYAPLYGDRLEDQTGRRVALTNLGVAGETSESFTAGPDSQLVRAGETLRGNPGAVVTLSLGGNDLLRVADATDAEREAAIVTYGQNLYRVLRTLNSASEPAPRVTVLALYNPAPGSFTDEWTGRLNAEIRAVAERNGASVADADRTFRGNEAEYAHHARYPWDVHPTDEGYEALARSFAEATPEG